VAAIVDGAILIITFVVPLVPFRTWTYSCPGTIRDGGILSYPRFAIQLPTMSTWPTACKNARGCASSGV
jgi:hypothetical protein